MTTVAQLLAACPLPRLEGRLLLMKATGLSRTRLMAWPETELDEPQEQAFAALQQRRIDGEPIAYLLGEKEFYGRSFAVAPGVLIPRPETEQLVDLALERLREQARPRILDLGTGSGAIAISCALERPDAEVWAVDFSAVALEIARANADRLQAAVTFCHGSWYEPLPSGLLFDLIVSNPPYIEAGDPHLTQGDLRFEPDNALTDFGDGLSCLRVVYGEGGQRLQPGAWVLAEHGYAQAEACRALCGAAGLEHVTTWQDLAGLDRITGGRRHSP